MHKSKPNHASMKWATRLDLNHTTYGLETLMKMKLSHVQQKLIRIFLFFIFLI